MPDSQRIVLSEYSERWPRLFEREAQRLRDILEDRALAIHHIGSTSVPGLPAKPVIDILLVVADSADEGFYVSALQSAGYALRIREPDWHQHRLFKGPDTDINLHVFSQGSSEIRRHLLFRDHIRHNADDRDLYRRTKQRLAGRDWNSVQDYADAKSEIIQRILERAGY